MLLSTSIGNSIRQRVAVVEFGTLPVEAGRCTVLVRIWEARDLIGCYNDGDGVTRLQSESTRFRQTVILEPLRPRRFVICTGNDGVR